MKKSVLLALLFTACMAQSQKLKTISVHFGGNGSATNPIQFLCTQKYGAAECLRDATSLRNALAPYPMAALGNWSFVLVAADEWKPLVRSRKGDPVSPAFSILDQRVTLLDASLLSGTATRDKELMERFSLMGPALLNLAITHEMGHGMCQEMDERRADDYGRDLRAGKTPDCSKTPAWKKTSLPASALNAPPP